MSDHTDSSRFPPLPARSAAPSWTPRIVTRAEAHTRPSPAPAERSVSTSVSDVLDYFEKCPRCGYPAQATATVRRYDNGRVETSIHPSCGLPCGWHGAVQVSSQQRVATVARPTTALTG